MFNNTKEKEKQELAPLKVIDIIQTNIGTENIKPLIGAEVMPKFPGGNRALARFFKENYHYPQEALENEIEGVVYVRFVVNPDGNLTNIKVVKGIGSGCDQEAIRLTSKMPKWIPGEHNNEKVAVYKTIPVSFKLPKKKAETAQENSASPNEKGLLSMIDLIGDIKPTGLDYLRIGSVYEEEGYAYYLSFNLKEAEKVTISILDFESNQLIDNIVDKVLPVGKQEFIMKLGKYPKGHYRCIIKTPKGEAQFLDLDTRNN